MFVTLRYRPNQKILGLLSQDQICPMTRSHFKRKRWSSKNHLAYVRSLPCLVCASPSGSADPHHVQFAEEKSLGTKVGDQFTVPLCRPCHNELHQSGIREHLWWSLKGIEPLEEAEEIYAKNTSKKSV